VNTQKSDKADKDNIFNIIYGGQIVSSKLVTACRQLIQQTQIYHERTACFFIDQTL